MSRAATAAVQHYGRDLTLVVLAPPMEGFDCFIGAWLHRGAGTVLVDPGPAATVPALAEALRRLEVTRLDGILLTHIHVDHAGGVGDLAPLFPEAAVVCHAAGMEHLADPTRLWEGTLRTLGETGRAYGPMRPVPAERLRSAEGFEAAGIRAVPTPGHAPHHVSFLADDTLFAGEAAGVHLQPPGGGDYLRPATPPRFFMPTAQESLARLLALAPARLCYGHLGMWPDGVGWLEAHRGQLQLWERILRRELADGGASDPSGRCIARLLAEDPLLARLTAFAPEVQRRERMFLRNSVKGFLGWLAEA